jgi:hypothetical protein
MAGPPTGDLRCADYGEAAVFRSGRSQARWDTLCSWRFTRLAPSATARRAFVLARVSEVAATSSPLLSRRRSSSGVRLAPPAWLLSPPSRNAFDSRRIRGTTVSSPTSAPAPSTQTGEWRRYPARRRSAPFWSAARKPLGKLASPCKPRRWRNIAPGLLGSSRNAGGSWRPASLRLRVTSVATTRFPDSSDTLLSLHFIHDSPNAAPQTRRSSHLTATAAP